MEFRSWSKSPGCPSWPTDSPRCPPARFNRNHGSTPITIKGTAGTPRPFRITL
jgi:hypothetical protein